MRLPERRTEEEDTPSFSYSRENRPEGERNTSPASSAAAMEAGGRRAAPARIV